MELLPVVHLSKESFKLDGLARSTPNAGNPCMPLVGCDGSERTCYDVRCSWGPANQQVEVLAAVRAFAFCGRKLRIFRGCGQGREGFLPYATKVGSAPNTCQVRQRKRWVANVC